MSTDYGLATQADRDDVMYVYKACIGTPGCTWSADYPSQAQMDNDIKNGCLFCYKRRGRIIGVVTLGRFGELDGIRVAWSSAKRHCELARIGVFPHGNGIGTQLLRRTIQEAHRVGYDSIRILVSPENKPALALYSRAGFKVVGEADKYDRHWYCLEYVR